MTKPAEFDGVEAEKAEAIRRFNNRKSFRSILRAIALASLIYLWFPTVANLVQFVCGWFYRTGAGIITNRTFVFFFANLLIVLIFVLSRDDDEKEEESGEAKPDLYDQYTSSTSAGIVTVSESDEKAGDRTDEDEKTSKTESDQCTNFSAGIVTVSAAEDDDSKKQIVPVMEAKREAIREGGKRIYRRTRSESKKEKAVREHRRTESAKIERLNSEEFRMEIEAFIKEKKMNLIRENVVVELIGNLEG